MARLLGFLDELEAGGKTDLVSAAPAIAGATGGRALCVILSDMLDPAGALAGAKAARGAGARRGAGRGARPAGDRSARVRGRGPRGPGDGRDRRPAARRLCARRTGPRSRSTAVAVDEGAVDLGAPVLRVTTAEPFDDVVAGALRAGLLSAGGLE